SPGHALSAMCWTSAPQATATSRIQASHRYGGQPSHAKPNAFTVLGGLIEYAWFRASRSARPEAPSARGITTQQREITAVHGRHAGCNDTVDFFTQRRVLPLDGREMARFTVEQHGCD